ncbi:hypothetical protein DV096_04175 [Bradymonadaceae bacterium TMQ3]|uniref:HEAT repeat domain-containing protein n=1 Tax=Lujinxingia sediminis TaxID=2480984 RepID=A0ABY0CX73_9DELT|nr:HEAT repeat domain-containing protein [Lujinxingia sediminis]RDV39770.1 hypothetical protein DV096_04175 [Bradymonadaceae bacterium TMQ3]RVU48186.1 hypothetical protein EA187_01750 [Lujinxingia sediminis]TXC77486.1 hypothetical protein FRC91_01760 [Bradymonadales bacterium TMQ1]
MTPTLAYIANSEARHRELLRILEQEQGSPAERRALLLVCLDDPYPPVRQDAARGLGLLMSDEVVEVLVCLARGQAPPSPHLVSLAPGADALDWQSSRAAVAALAALRFAPQVDRSSEVAAELLGDRRADVRFQALLTLYRVSPQHPAIASKLEVLLSDPDAELAASAAQIAVELRRSEMLPALLQSWQGAHGAARKALAVAVAELVDASDLSPESLPERSRSAVVDELTAMLREEAWVAQASRALAMLDGQAARDALHAVISRWFAHPLLKLDAATALMELGDARGDEHLAASLHARRNDVRGYALRLVGVKQLDEHLDLLIELAHSSDYHADTALLALADFGGEAATDTLRTIAQSHADPELRELARAGLALGRSPEPIAPRDARADADVDGAP